MSYDPTFKRIFGIQTKIKYTWDVIIPKKYEKTFPKEWKKFYRPSRNKISDTRKKQCIAFFKRLTKEGSDEVFCRRISIRFINSKIGYGVFAKEDIPKYAVLNHYAGVFKKDADISFSNKSTFSFEWKKFCIDGETVGNWCRFMNHSENTNVIAWEYYLPEGPRILFTAGPKGIKKGEQLVYSYGDDYWDEEDKVVALNF